MQEGFLDKKEFLAHLIEPAPWGKRLGAYLLDYFFFYICIIVLGAALGVVVLAMGFMSAEEIDEFGANFDKGWGSILDRLLTGLLHIVYYIFFELLVGRTPAKIILKLMVVQNDGTKPTIKQIFVRNFTRLIPFEALSFLGQARPFGLHDKWADTMVVEQQSILEDVYNAKPQEEY
jgi:uncharacterized RDD family membrane protein YckC